MKVFISITDPNGNESSYQVGRKARIIGRSEKSEIQVFDELTSGQHCKVYINAKMKLIVEDIGSKNGTSFNGIKKLKHTVYVGDKITFGSSSLSINTQKTDQEAIQYLTYQGNPAERKLKEMTLELEITSSASKSKVQLKSNGNISSKSLQKMSKNERAQFQHQKMYGDSLSDTPNNSNSKNMTFKYFLADCIDYTLPLFIFILSFLALYMSDPKAIDYLINLNFDKALDFSILGFPLAGVLMALLLHKVNRRNKKGSIGEKVLGIN